MMTSNVEDEDNGILYLHHVTTETPIKSGYRVKLNVDGSDIQLTRDDQISTWTPYKSLEISESTKARVTLKTGHTVVGVSFKKAESTVNINIRDAIRQFLLSMHAEISISEKTTFHQEPAIVTVSFRSPPNSELVRSTLQNLQESMYEFRRIMGDSTQKHLDTVIKYGVAFSELGPRSKTAFSVLSATFELLKQQKERDQMVSGLIRQLHRVLPFADGALKDTTEDNTDILRKAIGKLYILVTDVAEFSCEYVKRNRFKRLAKSMISTQDQDKVNELIGGLNEVVEDFSWAVNVEMLKAVRSIEEKVLLYKLQPIHTGYRLDRCCMEGTRVDVVGDIVEWASRPYDGDSSSITNTGNVYWLYGTPGIGKTAVAHSICARLHKKGILGGTFFCRRDDPDLSDPRSVLPTLVFNLAEMWEPYRKLVADKLRKDPKLTRHSADNELFSQLLEALESHPPHPIVMVIDALDECDSTHGRRSVLSSLFDACSRVNWLRIIVTCRPASDIERCFKRFDSLYLAKDLVTDAKAHEDIHFFARSKLADVASECGLPPEWPGKEKLEEIVDRSGGLFIFVETLARLLEVGLDPDQYLAQALSVGTGSAVERLYNLYNMAIRSQIGQNKEEFRSAMGTIIAVGKYRPLCDKSVAQITGLRPNIVTTLVNKLGSLLYRDAGTNGGIRVRHLSVIDFLTVSTTSEDLRVDTKRANRNVGMACLKIMTQELRFNICGIESSFTSNEDTVDLQSRIDQSMSDALQYSCLHWSGHLSHITDAQEGEVEAALEEFTRNPRLLYWIEALSVMGKAPVGDSVLRRIPLCLKSSQVSIEKRIDDAVKFLLAFREPIMRSAPHIYISGLAFVPIDTDLWKDTSALFKNLLVVERGGMKSWPARPSTLRGHKSAVKSVACSPDGRYIASGSYDKTIRIWDLEVRTAVGEPLKGDAIIQTVKYSPDGLHIISGSNDMTVQIWNAETGAAVGGPLKGHTDFITSVDYSPDGRYIASGSCDRSIRIWDVETGAPVGESLRGHTGTIKSIAYSPDGRRIISSSDDATIRRWDAETGAPVGEPLNEHTNSIWSVAYSPDGRRIISGSIDKTLRIWDAETGAAMGDPLEGHNGSVTCVACSPDGRRIISGSMDNTIRIWNATSGAGIGKPLEGHDAWISSVAYSPDGLWIISCSADDTIRIWSAETGASAGSPVERHTDRIRSVAYSPDGRTIVSGSNDNTIRIWNATTGTPVGEPLKEHDNSISSVAYSPDGRRLLSSSEDCTIRIWDTATWTSVGELLEGHTDAISTVAYSPDGHHIISGSDDCTIRIWNAATGAPVGDPLKGHTAPVWSIAYSPDSHQIISSSLDKTIRIWDAKTGAVVCEPLRGHTGTVWGVTYSPDGRRITSGSNDMTIRIWNAETGAPVGEPLKGHTGAIWSVAYSPDGRYIISGSGDMTIRIWDATTGASAGEPLRGHTAPIFSVAYSPDGLRIISGSADQTIRVWNPAITRAYSTNATTEYHPDANGWVHHPDGGLLFWVPEDCRNGLTCPAILTIPTAGDHRVVRLNLGEVSFGSSWIDTKMPGP